MTNVIHVQNWSHTNYRAVYLTLATKYIQQLEVFREDAPRAQLLHNTRISKHLRYTVYIILHRVSML